MRRPWPTGGYWDKIIIKKNFIILAILTVYSPPSSADGKNEWSYNSSPLLPNAFMAWADTSPFIFSSLQTQT